MLPAMAPNEQPAQYIYLASVDGDVWRHVRIIKLIQVTVENE